MRPSRVLQASSEWRVANSRANHSLFATHDSRLRVELCLARGLEQNGVERLGRALAGPDHELKCLEVALAGIERGAERRLALRARGGHAAGEEQRVAVHHQPVGEPDVEMA